MSFDLEAELLNAKLHLRQSIRRNAMLAKTAIHLEAEKVRDHIDRKVESHFAKLALRGFFRFVNRSATENRK